MMMMNGHILPDRSRAAIMSHTLLWKICSSYYYHYMYNVFTMIAKKTVVNIQHDTYASQIAVG